MTEKKRLDVYLFENKMAQSRQKAKALIMAGAVFVDGQICDKPSSAVSNEQKVALKEQNEFVSRGGKKLKKAIETFGLNLENITAIDIGASTGGFTDCMLKNGAAYVYAVDVGYGQLAWPLRSDSRVCVMERTNARYLTRDMFDKNINFASIDVSFISLRLILPALINILAKPFTIAALIKPQFEAGRDKVGKKGVVRDQNVHAEVIQNIVDFAKDNGFCVCGLTYSPIKGPEGNIEYLVCLKNCEEHFDIDIKKTVADAHTLLK